MAVDSSLQQAKAGDKERRDRLLRVKAAGASLAAASAGLVFGFAVGLHEARWADVWTTVAQASSPFSTQHARHG